MHNIIEPAAYVVSGEIKPVQELAVGAKDTRVFSNEEIHQYSLHNHYNTHLSKDGKTYTKIDRDGNYISHYVSPYAEKFWNGMNVESGVEPVVKALWQKGYLTFTSCQGHKDSPARYVGIVFINKNERDRFVKSMSHLQVNWHYDCVNPIDDPIENDNGNWMRMQWDQSDKTTKTQEDFTNKRYTKSELTKFWNIMFNRNYQSFSPVIMCVGCTMNPKNVWDYYWWKFKYKLTRNKVTKQVAKHITDNIDQYRW